MQRLSSASTARWGTDVETMSQTRSKLLPTRNASNGPAFAAGFNPGKVKT